MSVPRIIQQPGSPTADEDLIIGAVGQIRVDISRRDLRVHDGFTPGGKRLPNIDTVNALIAAATVSGVFANTTYDAIGSYLFAFYSSAPLAPNASVAGNLLTPTGMSVPPTNQASGGVRSGTWRVMGYCVGVSSETLFARIA